MNVVRSHFTPDIITAKVGDKVIVHLTNAEQTADATHGFAVPDEERDGQPRSRARRRPSSSSMDKPGTYSYYCTEFCSALHLEMQGWLIVEK